MARLLAACAPWFFAAHAIAGPSPLPAPDVAATFDSAPVYFAGMDRAGRIYLSGLFTAVDGAAVNHIGRFLADGTFDAGWRPALPKTGTNPAARVEEDGAGRIILLHTDNYVYTIDAVDGSSATRVLGSFCPRPHAMTVDPSSGTTYVACPYDTGILGPQPVHVWRMLAGMSYPDAWGFMVPAPPQQVFRPWYARSAEVHAFAHDGQRYLYIGGIVGGNAGSGIVRISTLPPYRLDTQWTAEDYTYGQVDPTATVDGIATDPDGWVYVSSAAKPLSRYSSRDGSADTSWRVTGTGGSLALDMSKQTLYVNGSAAYSTLPGAAFVFSWQPTPDHGAMSMRVRPDRLVFGTGGDVTFAGTNRRLAVAALPLASEPSLPSPIPRLVNVASRGHVGSGNNVLISGFIVDGPGAKTVAITVAGPSLASSGVTDALANPALTLVRLADMSVVAANDDWLSASNAALIRATGFAPASALEPAIVATLEPGPYTAIVTGADGGTGTVVVGTFELDQPEVSLLNASARGLVGRGVDVVIAGFVLDGEGPQEILVAAAGPSLAGAGIAEPLSDTTLTLVRSSDGNIMAFNDDWRSAPNAAAIEARGFAPSDPRESAILLTLDRGAYTAILSGSHGQTGVGLVEVYAP